MVRKSLDYYYIPKRTAEEAAISETDYDHDIDIGTMVDKTTANKTALQDLAKFADPILSMAYNQRNTKEFCNQIAKNIRYELQRWPHRNILAEDFIQQGGKPIYEMDTITENYIVISKNTKHAKKERLKDRKTKEIPMVKTSVSTTLNSAKDILQLPRILGKALATEELKYLIEMLVLGSKYGIRAEYFMSVKEAIQNINQTIYNEDDDGYMLYNVLSDSCYYTEICEYQKYFCGKAYGSGLEKSIIGFTEPMSVGVIPFYDEVEVKVTNKGNKYKATITAGYALLNLKSIIISQPAIIKLG